MKSQEDYRLVFEHSPQAMWLFDEETLGIVDVNQAAIATYGYSREEFQGKNIIELQPPADVSAGDLPRTWKHITKSGQSIVVEVASSRVIVGGRALRIAVVRDVSERIALEEQLREAQRIETVGQLAGEIAHDFNNLLMAILGHTEVLAEYFASGDPRANEIVGIRNAANLGASLTRQLLAFSRKQLFQSRVVDLNEVLDKSHRMLSRLLGEHVELSISTGEALRSVTADPDQIEQILSNLAVNARDAMPDGGRLSIRTQNITLEGALARRLSVAAGDYVELSVSDTGVGIDADARVHLFEPFFTTKDRARGTGLGLATVYGIVKQSGGHITVESEVGQGTRFAIYLPACKGAPNGAARVDARAVAGGSETVLIVEDDPAVRGLVAGVLGRRGYRVLVADHGMHALELLDSHPNPIHLVIADVVLAGTSVFILADAVRTRRPDTRLLYLSGYTDESVSTGFTDVPGAFVPKPFAPDTLARRVRATLDA